MGHFLRLSRGLLVEEVDGDVLVCDTDRSRVHRLTGEAADLMRELQAAGGIVMPDGHIGDALIAAGIVSRVDDVGENTLTLPTMSRRRAMQTGAAVAAAGVATLILPEAAAAATLAGSLVGPASNNSADAFVTNTLPVYQLDASTGLVSVRWDKAGGPDFGWSWSVQLLAGTGSGSPTGGAVLSGPTFWPVYTISDPGDIRIFVTASAVGFRKVTRILRVVRES